MTTKCSYIFFERTLTWWQCRENISNDLLTKNCKNQIVACVNMHVFHAFKEKLLTYKSTINCLCLFNFCYYYWEILSVIEVFFFQIDTTTSSQNFLFQIYLKKHVSGKTCKAATCFEQFFYKCNFQLIFTYKCQWTIIAFWFIRTLSLVCLCHSFTVIENQKPKNCPKLLEVKILKKNYLIASIFHFFWIIFCIQSLKYSYSKYFEKKGTFN